MANTHGFELLREREVPELSSTARLYRHVATGAELLSVVNDDTNKVFGVSFGTLPSDHTGVAHILEHAVLAGSRTYPLKDPFAELMKSSLATFLNASTYFDRTIYPVASQNLKDFYNLVGVYLDTVFHPLLRRQTFEQQGWHYELESADAELGYRGVVFNEMKGAHSSADEMAVIWQPLAALFPETLYGLDIGGDPRHIPELTYEQLREFHRTYYHPANARIFVWGDDPPEERLRLLDAALSGFAPLAVDARPPLQPPFDAPRQAEFSYDPGEQGGPAFATVAWALPEVDDPARALALRVLDQLLLGSPAAPLRRALTESGLGDDVLSSGIVFELRQPALVVGLRGVPPERAAEVEPLVLDTLRRIVSDGLPPEEVEAALNTAEFRLRELNTGRSPRGLEVFTTILCDWTYGRDPLAALSFEAPLAEVKRRAAAGRLFEGLVEELLANPHRASVVVRPDPSHNARLAADERERLAKARAAMGADELAAIVANTAELARWQETPDPPEALASIPSLALADLERAERRIPTEELELGGLRALYHPLASRGILYLDMGFDLGALPADLLPYAAIFGRLLLETGAGERSYVDVARQIGRETGGLRPELFSAMRHGAVRPATWLFVRGKATAERSAALAGLLAELLAGARLDNRERVRQIVLEERAAREAALTPEGFRFTGARLQSRLNAAGWASDQTLGAGSLLFLRRLAERVESGWPAVLADLERTRGLLLRRGAALLNVTADAATWAAAQPPIAALAAGIPSGAAERATWPDSGGPAAEALVIPAQVNYVAKGADLARLGRAPGGAALVAENLLSSGWLWEQVRVQGGAYACWSRFDPRSGVFSYGSYRDPHLLRTLDVYGRAGQFLREVALGPSELTRAIVGTVGGIDAHLLPDAQGFAALARALTGETHELRQALRDQVLGTSAAELRAFADTLDQVRDRGLVVVMGGQAAIDTASAERPGWLAQTKLME